ncbi:hypothetical protein [Paenibacillus arenilitoris]|uniref:Uncharacterized protein n=1 Tax=Paenibacillus arenilitoris TaxID=2772299 RepID=A0A927CS19_9BACL|nr:hypothetical protein [Paenibacillus arenilitoris]MBD2872137.1 hypothetical protein [Paenibacillus arenilitoris]
MKGNFDFKTNLETEIFCLEIALCMSSIYNITEEEAVGRVSEFWSGLDLTREDDMIFHESTEHWAGHIYFEDQFWWKKDVSQLAPRRYPKKKS